VLKIPAFGIIPPSSMDLSRTASRIRCVLAHPATYTATNQSVLHRRIFAVHSPPAVLAVGIALHGWPTPGSTSGTAGSQSCTGRSVGHSISSRTWGGGSSLGTDCNLTAGEGYRVKKCNMGGYMVNYGLRRGVFGEITEKKTP
jgi:hypothetical protein